MDDCSERTRAAHVAELATLRAGLGEAGRARAHIDAKIARLEAEMDRLQAAEARIEGGYRLFRLLVALLAAVGAAMAIPWLSR